MFGNKKKEVEDLILRENKKLKAENARLQNELDEIKSYKDEYAALVVRVKQVKKEMDEKLAQLDSLEEEYRKQLDSIINDE